MKILLTLIILLLTACGRQFDTTVAYYNEVPTSSSNITCTVYDLSSMNFSKIPDFDTIPSLKIGQIKVDQLDALDTNNTQQFSKFENTFASTLVEKFGLSCIAKLQVNIAGTHKFSLSSDDGSRLFINGIKVIDNDNLHGTTMVESNVNLSAGISTIKVEYFQNMGSKSLMLLWKEPGGISTIIPNNRFLN